MQIDNEFAVSVPIEQAWAVLTDLVAIAPCMPGAVLTGVEGDVYSGKVKVKVGPVTSEYAGTARFAEKDDAGYRAVIDAKGRDARGAGNASALITAQLRPDGASTVVSVSTDLKISGRIAQFGSGMIKEVSAKLLGQFVECLEGKVAATPADAAVRAGATAGNGAAAPAAAAAADGPAGPTAAVTAPAAAVTATGSAVTGPAATGSGVTGPAPAGAVLTGTAATVVTEPALAAAGRPQAAPAEEPPPLDLMSVAGSSIYKRVVPLIVLLVIIVGLVIYFAVR